MNKVKQELIQLSNKYGFTSKINIIPYLQEDIIIYEAIIQNTIPRSIWSSTYNPNNEISKNDMINRYEGFLQSLINSNNKTLQIIPKTVPQMEKETKNSLNRVHPKTLTFALFNKTTNEIANPQKYTGEEAIQYLKDNWFNFTDPDYKKELFGEEHEKWELIVFSCPSNPFYDLFQLPELNHSEKHESFTKDIIANTYKQIYQNQEEQYNLEKESKIQSEETTENTEKEALPAPVETPLTFQNFIGVQKTAGNEYSEYIEHLYKFYMQGKLSTFAFVDLIREMIQYIDAKASSLTPPIPTGTIKERSPKNLTSKSNIKALLDKEPNTPYTNEDIRKIGKYGELFMVISTDLAMGKTTDEIFVDTIGVAIEQMKEILYKVDSNSLPKYTEKDIVRAIQLARRKDENSEDDDLTNEEIFGEIVHTTDNKLYSRIEEEIGEEDLEDFWDEVIEDEGLEREILEDEDTSEELEEDYPIEEKPKERTYNLQDLKNTIQLARKEGIDGYLLTEEEIVKNVQFIKLEGDEDKILELKLKKNRNK